MLNLLMIIAPSSVEKKYMGLIKKYKIKFNALTHGMGTASKSLLNYFGVNETEKVIIFSVLPRNNAKHVLGYLKSKSKINEPGGGIAMTIPISSSTKYMKDIYADEELEDLEMDQSNKHLIITIANEGFAESIMNAAKKAGATGGTTINGRGLGTEKIVKFLGISIEPEKDIVMILVDEEKKNPIMDAIVESCGIKTPGAGICFSLPVENVVGLMDEK